MTKNYSIRKGNIENKKGWCFEVFFNGRSYPNIISGLYKSKQDTQKALNNYLFHDILESHGSAE